jgi:hypothetical protein
LDECSATNIVLDTTGAATLPFPGGRIVAPMNLVGLQWEFGIRSDHPGGCMADFTIDDIRLVPAP